MKRWTSRNIAWVSELSGTTTTGATTVAVVAPNKAVAIPAASSPGSGSSKPASHSGEDDDARRSSETFQLEAHEITVRQLELCEPAIASPPAAMACEMDQIDSLQHVEGVGDDRRTEDDR